MQLKSNPSKQWIPDLTRHGDVHPRPGPGRHGSGYKGTTILKPESHRVSGPMGLRLCSLAPSTRINYLKAVLGFTFWFHHHGDEYESLELVLDDYVFWCFDSRLVSRQQVVNLVSGLNYLVPTWQTLGVLNAAKKSLAGWKRENPTRSHLPIPRGVCRAVAVQLVQMGLWPVAAAIILAFDCYLRHSELRGLRVADVALPGDPRLQVTTGAVILLHITKAGRPQQVQVRDQCAIKFLKRLVHGRSQREFLFGQLRKHLLLHFKQAQVRLGFVMALFVLHSLRHGGASFDHMAGRPINDTMMRGRWSGLKITKTYIQESQARTLAMSVPRVVRQRMERYLASSSIFHTWLGL